MCRDGRMAQVFGFRQKILKTLAPLKWEFFLGERFQGLMYVSILKTVSRYLYCMKLSKLHVKYVYIVNLNRFKKDL